MTEETTTTALPATTRILRGPDQKGWYWGTGRRKTAVARVRIKGGSGAIEVNGKEFAEFFVEERDRGIIMNVLDKTGLKGKVDVKVNANGGGTTGQCGATLLDTLDDGDTEADTLALALALRDALPLCDADALPLNDALEETDALADGELE